MPENQTQYKKAFLQLIYAIGYFLLFFAVQYFTAFVFSIYFGLQKTSSDRMNGIPINAEWISQYIQNQLMENMNYLLAFYSALFVIILLLFFAIRKKNFFEETRLRKFPVKTLPGVLILVPGMLLFINGCLNLIPVSWLTDFIESSSFISKGSFAFSMVTQGVIAPLIEELVFRGLMLSRLNAAFPKWFGIIVSSILFGAAHGTPVWFVFAMFIGVILCLIANKTNSIFSTFIIHALYNCGGTFFSYAKIEELTMPILICAVLIGAVLTATGLFLIRRHSTVAKNN